MQHNKMSAQQIWVTTPKPQSGDGGAAPNPLSVGGDACARVHVGVDGK